MFHSVSQLCEVLHSAIEQETKLLSELTFHSTTFNIDQVISNYVYLSKTIIFMFRKHSRVVVNLSLSLSLSPSLPLSLSPSLTQSINFYHPSPPLSPLPPQETLHHIHFTTNQLLSLISHIRLATSTNTMSTESLTNVMESLINKTVSN